VGPRGGLHSSYSTKISYLAPCLVTVLTKLPWLIGKDQSATKRKQEGRLEETRGVVRDRVTHETWSMEPCKQTLAKS
jgi:hypothetical protein